MLQVAFRCFRLDYMWVRAPRLLNLCCRICRGALGLIRVCCWFCVAQIFRGVLRHDAALVDEGFAAVWSALNTIPPRSPV